MPFLYTFTMKFWQWTSLKLPLVVLEILSTEAAISRAQPLSLALVLGSPVLGSSGPWVLGSLVLRSLGSWSSGPWVPGPRVLGSPVLGSLGSWSSGPWVLGSLGPWVLGSPVFGSLGPWSSGPAIQHTYITVKCHTFQYSILLSCKSWWWSYDWHELVFSCIFTLSMLHDQFTTTCPVQKITMA